VLEVDRERFEELVGEALDLLPDELAEQLDNVIVRVHDEPIEDGLLGLYEGIPLTEREAAYTMTLPDRITIYRRPVLAICRTEADVVHEVRTTVIHEVAHHFGIDDARLDELGWA
jgi:predicted Zn-dependent protease with MMP-like domain